LVTRFAPLVRHVVERIAATLPKNVDHEDLYSAGVLGLLDAHAKFDPRKGVKFETYAVWRIKGAVLDQLRALDWVSRSMRRKARNLDGVTRRLDQKLGRAASEEEVARELKMSRDDFYRLLDHVRAPGRRHASPGPEARPRGLRGGGGARAQDVSRRLLSPAGPRPRRGARVAGRGAHERRRGSGYAGRPPRRPEHGGPRGAPRGRPD